MSEPARQPEVAPAGLSPQAEAFRAYWDAKRRGRRMPARADIDPLDMKPWLGEVLLLDVLEGGRDFRYRLVGAMIAYRTGYDMTGKLLSEMPGDPAAIANYLADHRRAVETRAPVHARYDYISARDSRPVKFERLLLPLSDDGETVNMLLGLRHDLVGEAGS